MIYYFDGKNCWLRLIVDDSKMNYDKPIEFKAKK